MANNAKTNVLLEKSGIIRFYKHSNKLNFLEGTDIDIEQELAHLKEEIQKTRASNRKKSINKIFNNI